MNNKYFGLYGQNGWAGGEYPRRTFPFAPPFASRCPSGANWARCGCCQCGCMCCPPEACCPRPCPPCEECRPGPYRVVFLTNGGEPVPQPQTVPYGGLVARPPDPVRVGYTFAGWYVAMRFAEVPWNFDTDVVTGDMTLCARWTPNVYQVTFDAEGGMPTPPTQMVQYGGLATRPADPERVGYTFTGWYTSPGFTVAPWDFDTDVVVGDTTLYARWTPTFYTVTFDTNGGAPTPAPQTVAYGGHVIRPTDPIREDYVFVAWYPTPTLTGIPWSFTNEVTSNMTLYARWLSPV